VVSGRVRQSALPIRRKSTCLRMTSNGSAPVRGASLRSDLCTARDIGLICAPRCDGRRAGSRDKALAPMCQVNFAVGAPIPPGGISLAGPSRASARRRYRASDAGSHTRSRRGTSHGAADGTTSRSCFHCRAPPDKSRGGGCWRVRWAAGLRGARPGRGRSGRVRAAHPAPPLGGPLVLV